MYIAVVVFAIGWPSVWLIPCSIPELVCTLTSELLAVVSCSACCLEKLAAFACVGAFEATKRVTKMIKRAGSIEMLRELDWLVILPESGIKFLRSGVYIKCNPEIPLVASIVGSHFTISTRTLSLIR